MSDIGSEAENSNFVVSDADAFSQISIGMTIGEVTSIMGSPGESVGCGFIVYQYLLPNSTTAYINYLLNEKNELVVCSIIVK